MRYQNDPKAKLEQAVAELRGEQPDSGTMESAGERVWQHLSDEIHNGAPVAGVEAICGCADVRVLLPQYQAGRLSPARTLLVEAHLHECPACRTEAEQSRSAGALLAWKQELPRTRQNHFRWLATAAAVIVVGVAGFYIQDKLAIPAGARARVESVNGGVYLVSAQGLRPLQPGAELQEGEKVRTAGNSRAMLRLRDGSLVEMSERAEFAVSARRTDTTIDLNRGNIIVQAAKRDSGHLYVAAQDCKVSVTGTVFAVNSGMKGSRVSVIQGEVRVAHAGLTDILHPGDQLTTSAAVAQVPVRQEIAWSQNFNNHLKLLAEFAHLQNKLQNNLQFPGLRYESKLLPLLPANTLLYAGIPNLGDAIDQANKLFQQELQESDVLREWWQQESKAGKGAPDFQQAVEKIHELGQYLGNEIVFSAQPSGERCHIIIVAEVAKPGLKEFIEQQLAQQKGHHEDLQVFTEQELMNAAASPRPGGLVIVVRPDYVIAGSDVPGVREFDLSLKHGGAGFGSTDFATRLEQAYNGGAGLLLGVDLQAIEQRTSYQRTARGEATLERTGLSDVKYLIAERKDSSGQTLNRAELSFNSARHGMASWLAAPAPIGGLDFVSPNAGAVAAAVTKSPAQIFDDLQSIVYATGAREHADAELNQVESELKIKLREDLASTLGGEATIALDGPILPTPSWKLIVEVNDPTRLQQTIQQLIADANAHASNGETVKLDQQVEDGITYYTVLASGKAKPVEITYAFTDGYLIAAASRALVMDAIKIHKNGNSLAKSGDFHNLLPPDQFTDVSALIYQNLAPVVGPVVQQLSPEQLDTIKALAAETKPSLVCAYGEPNAIRVASTSRFFGMDLNTLMLTNLLKLTERRRQQQLMKY